MSDQELMVSINQRWAAGIIDACRASSVPPALLAALVANESGGDETAQRFEPAVFDKLKNVLMGLAPQYSPSGARRPLKAVDLVQYCDPGSGDDRGSFQDSLRTLHALATSWGLTQIMGWHLVEFQSGLGVTFLATAGGNLTFSTRLLGWFAEHYNLSLSDDAADLLHCWNTGVPGGDPNHPTYDPNYVPNGLARMALYAALPSV